MQMHRLAKGRCSYRGGLLVWCIGIVVALLFSLFLSWVGVATQIDNQFTLLGFDTERVSLLTSLLLALLSSLCAALFLQRCGPTWIGGLIFFVLRSLLPFVEQAMHPSFGPAGQVQVLIPGAFISVIFSILALGLLFAGAGAVIGKACGQILVVPLITLSRHIFARAKQSRLPQTIPSVAVSLSSLAIGALVVSIVILSAAGAGPLLTYGPTTNLYQFMSVQGNYTPSGSWSASALTTGVVQSGTFSSPALGRIERKYWIYLPPSYSVTPSHSYPTFYLLHGSPGGPNDWFQGAHAATTADALIATGKMRETILIEVDGNGPVYRFSEWANSFDGRQRMEDALVQDLVPFIDHHYHTLADAADRVIGGLSMGGYGAVNIALHHPEVFHGVMSVGGYFQAEGPVFGSGSGSGSNAYRQLNSPSLLLQTPAGKRAASMMLFVIGVGTTDGRYHDEGVALYEQLRTMGVRVHLLIAVGGHSWSLWAQQFGEALPLLELSHTSLRGHLFLRNRAAISPLINPYSLFCCRPLDGSGLKLVREEKLCLF